MIQKRIVSRRYQINKIDEAEYSKEVWERKEKLEKYELLMSEGNDESVALQVIGIPRSTLFRWQKNYRAIGLGGLENASRRPNKLRKPLWGALVERRIYSLRIQYPLWGKDKIAIKYRKIYGTVVSASTAGRIIKKLVQLGHVQPVAKLSGHHIPKRRIFDGYAQRWKSHMKAQCPGEMIQIDHMTVYVQGQGYLKQFNAICPITKLLSCKVYKEANSTNAADFLEYIRSQLPFEVRSIQVDGGSEFMLKFEQKCQNLGLSLYVLPPRSPECNAHVERSNRTFKGEFYSQYPPGKSLHALQRDLSKFTDFYNKKRPHQGLGYLTPWRFYCSIREGGQVSYVLN
jgi:hypothetical protein